MVDLSIFNGNQKKILRFLYEHNGDHTFGEICQHCGSMQTREIESLTTSEYGQAVQCSSSPHRGNLYRIAPQGRGIWEELCSREADKSYQRNHDAQALDIARESNTIAKGAKKQASVANWLSFFALAASIVSIFIALRQMLVF